MINWRNLSCIKSLLQMPASLPHAFSFFTISSERHFYNFQILFIKYLGLKVQEKELRDDQVSHVMICCLVTFQRSHELKGTLWYWGQNLAFTGNNLWSSSKRYSALSMNSTQISNTINQSWNRAFAIHLPKSAPDCTVIKDLRSPTTSYHWLWILSWHGGKRQAVRKIKAKILHFKTGFVIQYN